MCIVATCWGVFWLLEHFDAHSDLDTKQACNFGDANGQSLAGSTVLNEQSACRTAFMPSRPLEYHVAQETEMPVQCKQAVGRLLDFPSDATLATPEGKVGSGAEGPQAMEMDMSLTGSAQVCIKHHATHCLLSSCGFYAIP